VVVTACAFHFARNHRARRRLRRQTPTVEVGTMRWKVTFDNDDLTLAVATIVSAVAISLALI
jgi:hypothetical protein